MAMSDTLAVFFTCVALLAGTFICGYAPSLIKASPKVMNLISVYGGGIIVGLAIAIILPEAASILINAQHKLDELNPDHSHEDHEHNLPGGHVHSHEDEIVSHEMGFLIGTAILIGFVVMLLIDESTAIMLAPSTGGGFPQKEITDKQEMEPLMDDTEKQD